jgi:hypothetical protein
MRRARGANASQTQMRVLCSLRELHNPHCQNQAYVACLPRSYEMALPPSMRA